MLRRRPRSSGGRRNRWILWPGVALIVAGLGLLAYVAWQFVGTNYVSHRHQHHALAQVRQAWAQGERAARTPWGEADAIIRIPRFGPGYAVPVFAGTGEDVLAAGYGHFTGTAGPGQVGNYAVAAHRVTHGQPLRGMPQLEPGDVIHVDTRNTTYTYRLTSGGDDLVVPFTATWVTEPLPTNPAGGIEPLQRPGQRLITLTTCAELFHTDNRMVAFGVLVSRSPRT